MATFKELEILQNSKVVIYFNDVRKCVSIEDAKRLQRELNELL